MRRSLLLVALLAAGCSSQSADHGSTVTPTSQAPTASRTAMPAFAVTPLTGPLKFVSVDHNLGCDIESAYARCDPAHHAWPLPPQPSDCASGWGHGIEVQAGTKASFFCGSDSVAGGSRVLTPGHAFRLGFMQCDAIGASTIHCHGTSDAHGFTISRAQYSLT
ncbi:MAG: hypothetical protein ABR549_05690 [Mycobacteriales bacterium]